MRTTASNRALRRIYATVFLALALLWATSASAGTVVIENLRYSPDPAVPGVSRTPVTVFADAVYQGNFDDQGRRWITSCFMNDSIGGNLAPTQPPDYGTPDSSNTAVIQGEGDVLPCEPAPGNIPNCDANGNGVGYIGWATAAIFHGLNGNEFAPPAVLAPAYTVCVQHFTVRGVTTGLPADGGVELTLAIYQDEQLLRTQKLDRTVNGSFRFRPPSIPDGGRFNVLITALRQNTFCTLADDEGTIQGADWLDLKVNCRCATGEQCDDQAPTFELGFDVLINVVSDGDAPLAQAPGPIADALGIAPMTAAASTFAAPVAGPGFDHSTTDGEVSFSASLQITPADGGPPSTQVLPVSSSGFFRFPESAVDGSDYQFTMTDLQPLGAQCDVANESGTVNGSDVSNIQVECEVYVPPDDWCVPVPEMCLIDDPDCQYYFRYVGRTTVTVTDSSGNVLSGRVTDVYELQATCTGNSLADPGKGEFFSSAVAQQGASSPTDSGPMVYMRTAPDEVVSGIVEMAGVARRDSGGVGMVRAYLNGQPLQLTNFGYNLPDSYTCGEFPAGNCDGNSRFFGQLDTTTLPNGPHTILFEAVGANGLALSGVAEHRIVVDNPAGCGSVNLTQPQPNAIVSDTQVLSATVSGSAQRVEFLVDGTVVRVDPTAPYTVVWDSNLVVDGPYEVKARVVRSGCTALSAPVPIEVENSPCTGDQSPPLGQIIAPASGSVVTPNSSGRVFLSVSASDDQAVNYVQFHVDGQLVWTDGTAPYQHNWLATSGDHTLTARIVDECGNFTWTNPVTFTVSEPDPCDDDTVHPTVGISQPTAGSTVTPNANGRVTLAATASDGGGLDRVEFLVDNSVVWTDTTFPFAHNWPATTGGHTVRARAVDTCGNATTSAPISFTVEDPDPCSGDSTPPFVSLTQPTAGSTVTPNANGRVTLAVSASDAGGVDRVEFFIDGSQVWLDETAPYAHNWPSSAGSHSFKVRAYDTCGNARWSNEITFTVSGGGGGGCSADSVGPAVNLTQPAAGSTQTPNANGRVTLGASASDASGVDRVEFFIDGSQVWTDETDPFLHNWPSSAGAHSFKVRAFDTCGNARWSNEITFTVSGGGGGGCSADSVGPAVNLTQPAAGSTQTPNANGRVTLGASASDASGVDRVEFFIDGSQVWTDETDPFLHNWPASAGAHSFKVRAFDTCGNARWSNEITFTVSGGGGGGCSGDITKPTVTMTQPAAGSTQTPNGNGRVTLGAVASDASGVDRVEFHIDGGAYIWTDDTDPYLHNWLASAGAHTVKARAFDECGNSKWSTEVSFSVAP